jgi:hypothetical protein
MNRQQRAKGDGKIPSSFWLGHGFGKTAQRYIEEFLHHLITDNSRRVSMALLMSLLALAALPGKRKSNEYTKIFVSRKNLPLIHFVPVETPADLHMLQPFHESVKILASTVLSGKLLEPLTKQGVERFMLGFCERPGLLD